MADELSVRVAVRIRPQLPRELIDLCRVCTTVTPEEPQITLGADKSFTYDFVFDCDSSQDDVYMTCAEHLITGSLQGYNATLLAYGQTGSGKTFTMGTGFDIDLPTNQVGIIPRAINQLFSDIERISQDAKDLNQSVPQFKVTAQFLELYNDEIIDLFDPSLDYSKRKSSIKIHEDSSRNIYLSGVTVHRVNHADEALKLLRQGALSRTTASTQMNETSSRSHAIFTLHIVQQRIVKLEVLEDEDPTDKEGKQDFETLTAKFHFVDLAGSERLKRTGASGDRAREGIAINSGLLALGNVISALGDASKKALHIPYRDSKLTRLLQDSLGGNSRTLMIACVSPSDRDFMETLNTLKYANRARNIQNKVVINQDKSSRTIMALNKEIAQLKLELLEYKQGKRLCNEDGKEIVNDMFHENTLLQNEVDNLRSRIKGMQETIDGLTAKNAQLLAEHAAAEWINQNSSEKEEVTELIKGYMSEIENLRAKLVEAENISTQLRKSRSVLSPVKISNAPGIGLESLIELAKQDVEKNLESIAKTKAIINISSDQSDESSSESDSDENDEIVHAELSNKLATITSEISLKQRLIEELEKSQRKMNNMKIHYEEKLNLLQAKIEATQKERDAVLANHVDNKVPSDKVRKIKEEYEKKLFDMQREMKNLQNAKKEHAKLLRMQNQRESQLNSLNMEVSEMKRTKVKLMNKMKEEMLKRKEADIRHNREVAQLRKKTRKDATLIKTLELDKKMKAAILKRKQEEVAALRRTVHAPLKYKYKNNQSSPKAAKQKWLLIEKNISQNSLSKQEISSLERELDRKIEARTEIQEELQAKLAVLKEKSFSNSAILHEEIDTMKDSLDHIQTVIAELQHEILQAEENKPCFNPGEILQGITSLPEASYLSDKLYNMALHLTYLTAAKESEILDLQAKYDQVVRENKTREELLKHILERNFDRDAMYAASGSNSRTPSPSENKILNWDSNVSASSVTNRRKLTFRPGEMLYSSEHPSSTVPSPESTAPNPLFPKSKSNNKILNSDSNVNAPPLTSRRKLTLKPGEMLYCPDYPSPTVPSPELSASNLLFSKSKSNKVHSVPSSPANVRKAPSPMTNRKNLAISNHPSMEKGLDSAGAATPPLNSPGSYRRQVSREEDVFSRLTTAVRPSNALSHRPPGKITTIKRPSKGPLLCSHFIEGHSRTVLTLHATNEILFTGSQDRSVVYWDLNEMKEVHVYENHPTNVVSVKFDPIHKLLFTVSGSLVKIWDSRSHKCVKTLTSSGLTASSSTQVGTNEAQVNDIAVNNKQRILYAAAGDKVRVWDLRKYSVLAKLMGGHQAAIMCLAVITNSLNGESDIVYTGSKDHYIKMFEVGGKISGVIPAKETLEPPHYDGIQCLAVHDNILFSGSRDGIIKKWADNELLFSHNSAHKDWITGFSYLWDKSYLISACRDGSMKLWSTYDLSLVHDIKAHPSSINAIECNNSHLFTASSKEVKMWNLPSSPQQDLMTMSTGHMFELSV